MAVHIHPIEIPPRYYKPIGQIVAGANLTEVLIASIIWRLHKIKDPPTGRLFTYNTDFVEKLRILRVTANRYVPDPVIKARLRALYEEANSLRIERNAIVHGLWGRMPKEKQTWKVFQLQKADEETSHLKRKVVHLNDLKNVAARVRILNKDLKKLMRQIGASPP